MEGEKEMLQWKIYTYQGIIPNSKIEKENANFNSD